MNTYTYFEYRGTPKKDNDTKVKKCMSNKKYYNSHPLNNDEEKYEYNNINIGT